MYSILVIVLGVSMTHKDTIFFKKKEIYRAN